jgi:murein DD-endopeptidase MepM/ murein hydrolase activator NlpD
LVMVLFVLVSVSSVTPVPVARAGSPPAGRGGKAQWSPPVDGPVVRRFEPPAGPYGPGHRGVDFAVAPGTPVRAVGAGVVSFAGRVAGPFHVVVAHPGGLRTSYAFLRSVVVARGDPVQPGAILGFSGGTGSGHAAGVVHLGLREGGEYRDPLRLFGPPTWGETPVGISLVAVDGPPSKPAKCRTQSTTLTANPAPGRESTRPHSIGVRRIEGASSGQRHNRGTKESLPWLSLP